MAVLVRGKCRIADQIGAKRQRRLRPNCMRNAFGGVWNRALARTTSRWHSRRCAPSRTVTDTLLAIRMPANCCCAQWKFNHKNRTPGISRLIFNGCETGLRIDPQAGGAPVTSFGRGVSRLRVAADRLERWSALDDREINTGSRASSSKSG